MIQSSVTISLVSEARGGPFVYWDDLAASCEKAAALGFDAVEVFAPSPDAVDADQLRGLLESHKLKLSAVGTGAGWVIRQLQLCDPDAGQRERAKQFIRSIIDMGSPFSAPAIIGSMQGRWGGDVDQSTAIGYLSQALDELGAYAERRNVVLIYEPLNRYETNLVNTIADGVQLLSRLSTGNVKLLADLFHMNIEESNVAEAIRAGKDAIGHLHFVDSNRQPVGRGHMQFEPIATALRDIGYAGYASAEAFPLPDSDEAARLTMEGYNKYLAE